MKIVRRLDTQCTLPNWNLDPILTRIFWSRGIKEPSEVAYSLTRLQQPLFKDLEHATQIICEAVIAKQKILVVGDYDCDGATSTALALRFFNAINYSPVEYIIPNRNIDGYGLNELMVQQAFTQQVKIIITVDNGISACKAIKLAKDKGIKVVVTDHHLPPDTLPPADAIVNPQREDCAFKSKNIAGVGVVFYVLTSVCRALEKKGYFKLLHIEAPDMKMFLDLVAIGTVADVVPMDYNNRVMVSYGIELIRNKYTSQGLKELIRLTKCPLSNFTSSTIGFGLSPRLNAAGRIDNMRHGVDCLLTNEVYEAKVKASFLDGLNGRRRLLEKDMLVTAKQLINANVLKDQEVLVIYSEKFIRGIVGILAAKLQDEYLVPVVVFADGPELGSVVGSARADGDLHIRQIFEKIAQSYPGKVLAFGGHKTAAGITLQKDFLSEFSNILRQIVSSVPNRSLEKTFLTDGELPASYISAPFARTLVFDQPWGKDFALPEFDGVFLLLKCRLVGSHLRLLFRLVDGREIWGMFFHYKEATVPQIGQMVRVVYSLDISSNRNDASISLIVRGLEKLP